MSPTVRSDDTPIDGAPAGYYRSLGRRLLSIRRDRGLTAEQVAIRCGWSVHKVRRLETGERRPSAWNMEHYAAAVGVPVAHLYGQTPLDELAQLLARPGVPGYVMRQISGQELDWLREQLAHSVLMTLRELARAELPNMLEVS